MQASLTQAVKTQVKYVPPVALNLSFSRPRPNLRTVTFPLLILDKILAFKMVNVFNRAESTTLLLVVESKDLQYDQIHGASNFIS